jgi:hypothetical protein
MPHPLESGKLWLAPDEATIYQPAADRLREACEMSLDLTQPVRAGDWCLLQLAHCGLAGNLRMLDHVIAVVENAIRSRAEPN